MDGEQLDVFEGDGQRGDGLVGARRDGQRAQGQDEEQGKRVKASHAVRSEGVTGSYP